mmetsp:Transcript_37595/g.76688  ORF Transcript_37595/g.76688 Transcript_37595/m.76688 type:complete len:116 (-) Transcript_37595:39-386(-)|eukprot:CAMPEP_0183290842 /NCGR_PEP_ID=MMETSP0160_2-20130417/430_1 /TAXON_ID=2839 ORGANISM="Odontella Sinensis, Strain Grunow 1884" /NCGR_SAMPLE_ID=MMETSP0160_2 /ASSEMBLY_ACC=CAM_ASM_000250 /LENGTH=115 /DNA_ID=CAMNT_0025451525 /DNA_START=118 /DNA_END=465 /DNA_ORIENTATION=+
MAPSAPKLKLVGATETVITVEFAPSKKDTVGSYDLCWKEYVRNWDDAELNKNISKDQFTGKAKVTVSADDLNPGTTYAVRLVAKDADGNRGNPGPELIIDTDAVSCAPKSSCVLL